MPIPWRRLLAIVLVALTAVVVALALARVLRHDDAPSARLVPGSGEAPGSGADTVDPLAWTADRSTAYAAAAARGLAHPLYAQSPGGVLATARRVDRYRPVVESVARASGLDPDTIEAMVFLESAGRPDAAADPELDGAVGLTQILAETGRNLLGMTVDPAGARRIGRSIRRNEQRGRDAVVARLKARRRAIDQRFDPVASLRATARYLTLAKRELGRDDLAVVSYHMGIGNLQDVLRDYGDDEVPYAQLFFDSTPLHHPAAWSRLASFGDDSSTYLWRVEAARDIMRRWREDPAALERLDVRQTAKASAEEVLHPRSSTRDLRHARRRRARRGRRGPRRRCPCSASRTPASPSTRAWASSRAGSTRSGRATGRCGPRRSRCSSTSAPGRRRSPGPARSSSRAPCATPATSASWPRRTSRPPTPTACTPPATRSTSSATTRRAARPARSSSCSTASPRWTSSPGCASRPRSTSRSRLARAQALRR